MKSLFTILLAVAPLSTFSQQKLEITPLAGNFYVYTTYHDLVGTLFPANGMYVVTEDGVVIFDTPWDTAQFQPLLDSIRLKHGKPVKLCIATHSHEDRTAGLTYYRSKGIETWTSAKTDSICRVKNRPRAEFTFEKDTVFTLGQYSFKMIYPGAGHTFDNIIGWFPEEKILYGGCLIKSTEAEDPGNLEDADVKAWPETMKNVQRQCPKPKFIIPGHQDWHSRKAVKHTIKIIRKYNNRRGG